MKVCHGYGTSGQGTLMSRVLIVAGESDNLAALRSLLEGDGYVVDEARYAAEALAQARRHPPALVISDLLLPEMGGHALLRQWRGDERLKSIPFVVYAATPVALQQERLLLDLGADALVVKAAGPEAFRVCLREAIERARSGGQPADQSDDHVFKAFAVCPVAIAISRWSDRRIIDVNASFLDLVGCTREEAIGRTPQELGFAAPDAERLRASFEARHAASNVELVLTRRGGDTRHLVMGAAFATLRNERHAIASFFDITDRKIAEETRRRNEERYLRQRDALITLTSARMDYADGLGPVLGNITETAARTLGVARVAILRYSPDRARLQCVHLYRLDGDCQSSGMELDRSTYPAYFKALDQKDVIAADDAGSDPRTTEFAESHLRPLGIAAMLSAPMQVGGAVAGVVCHEHVGAPRRWTEDEQVFGLAIANAAALALEGWERRQVERALGDAQTRLERALSAGNVGLWDWDLASSQVFYSTEWKRQLGCEDPEISGGLDEWESRLHPDDRARALDTVKAYLAQPGPALELEFRLRHKSGSYRHILSRGSLLRNEAGEAIRLLGSHVDITEQTELRAQFLQSQKMESVGQLAGGVAHDFNNLLTVINGTADLALENLEAGDPMRADLLQIRDAGNRATSLTSQLLAFSRKQIMKPDVLDLNALVKPMQAMLQRLIGEHIELVFAAETPLGSVRADAGQIEQVVMNLAVNARDAMPDGGMLTIETQDVELDADYAAEHPTVTPGRYVMLAVSDNGVGMDEATRERIFEPFFTTKSKARGTGLGLSTVYGIVTQSGGNVWVYSEPGRGTTFKIYLPRVDEAARVVQPARTPTATRGTGTILVVEDETAVRNLATRVLHSAGYTVVTASNATEALSLLDRHEGTVDLMLTDLVMPGMSGRELAERLADIRPGIKVLYTSGYTDDTVLRHGVIDNSAQFIGKPYTVTELTRKVRELLDPSTIGGDRP